MGELIHILRLILICVGSFFASDLYGQCDSVVTQAAVKGIKYRNFTICGDNDSMVNITGVKTKMRGVQITSGSPDTNKLLMSKDNQGNVGFVTPAAMIAPMLYPNMIMTTAAANASGAAINSRIDSIQLLRGPTGPSGAQGTQGVVGNTGPVGSTGAQGSKGDTGSQGAAGSTGVTGSKGDTGPVGATGISGAAGTNGTNGTNGLTGSVGPTGSQGTAGLVGATGPNGITGVTGSTGSTGVSGATGPSGVQGATGVISIGIPTAIASASKSFNTAYQVSSTNACLLSLSASAVVNIVILGNASATATLQVSANGSTGWITIGTVCKNVGSLIGLSTTNGSSITYNLPAGYYWQIVTTSTTSGLGNTGTFTFDGGAYTLY